MREIKFKAWDKKNKKWVGDEYYIDLDGCIYSSSYYPYISGMSCANDLIYEKDWELVQYTGLKDRTGEEIFESDIVEMVVNIMDGYDPTFNSEITHNENLHYKIVMGDIPEWLKLVPITDDDNPYSCEDYSWWLAENPEIKIIGNIYENPELLENEDK